MANHSASSTSRRSFLKKASAGAVLSGTPAIFVSKTGVAHQKRVSPSDRVRIAVVGGRNIGWANLRSHLKLPEVECVAICDVDQSIREKRIQDTEAFSGNRPKGYNDFRELYERNDLGTQRRLSQRTL